MGKEFSDTVIPDRKLNEVKEGAKISKRTFSIIQISTKALCRIKFIFEYQQVGYDSWNKQGRVIGDEAKEVEREDPTAHSL